MPAKKASKKTKSASPGSRKKTTKKQSSGPFTKAKKAVGSLATSAGKAITGAVKAVTLSGTAKGKKKSR